MNVENMAKEVESKLQTIGRDLTNEEQKFIEDFKAKAAEMEQMLGHLPGTRYAALAFTHLEQSVMWAVRHLEGQPL